MSPIPPFVAELRSLVGRLELWMPAVTAVVVRPGSSGPEILLTLRADNGQWAPITGIVDPAEEPAHAAVREAFEECSVQISADRLASVSVSPKVIHANGDPAVYLDLTFACSWVSGEAAVGDDENTDVRWWPLDALPPMKPYLRRRIDDVLADEPSARFLS